MYLGQIVEKGTPKEIFRDPKHPYTQALIQAIPSPDPENKQALQILKGEVPSPLKVPTGCRFHTRCPHVMDVCKKDMPALVKRDGRLASCHLYEVD